MTLSLAKRSFKMFWPQLLLQTNKSTTESELFQYIFIYLSIFVRRVAMSTAVVNRAFATFSLNLILLISLEP